MGHWQLHYEQKATSGISQLATCANKYAERNLTPVWFNGIPFTNGADALNYAMDVLTFRFRENGFRNVESMIIYRIPPKKGCPSTIFARTSDEIKNVSLSATINPLAIDNLGITDLNLTGSLYHAWFHRCGYEHPEDVYTTYLIAEAPMCIMRGFQPKIPGEPDSVYTQYFD